MELSREQAEKEFGMKIRSQKYGTNQVGVWLDFKPTGKLEGFSHVDLEIAAGEKNLVSAPLLVRPGAEGLTVRFTTDPIYLATSRLTVVVWKSERTRVGYQLRVKDFVGSEPPR